MDRYGVHTKTEVVNLALRPVAGRPMLGEEARGMRGARALDVIGLHLPRFDAAVDLSAATRIYRACRRGGITPHGPLDRAIAAMAWRHHATLLCHDADLRRPR